MRIIYMTIVLFVCFVAKAQDFPYRSMAPFIISSSEEYNCMFFDKEGMMWIGTNVGLKSYDGYNTKVYKSNAYSPGLLPNNTIRSITEDHQDNLWLGTRNGLVRMNKRTGKFKTFLLPSENQRIIYTLFTSKDGTVWIGTDGGLSFFDPKKEAFHTFRPGNTKLIDENGRRQPMASYSVKAIIEDKNGDLLIGTWSSGLLRFNKKGHVFYRYPQLNATNSAYSLFFDRKQRLWVGTWGYGVVRIDNPQDIRNAKYYYYPYHVTHFDTFYKFVEDPITQTLWACTREGVCFLKEDDPHANWQCYSQINGNSLTFNNDIATDEEGNIWLCTQLDGIMQITTRTSPFKIWKIGEPRNRLTINYLCSIFTTDGEWFWLGLNPYGIALYDRRTGVTYYNKEIPGFDMLNDRTLTTSISCVEKRSNDELWFAVNSYGIIVKPKMEKARELNVKNSPFIKDNFVNTLFESHDKIMWIGTRSGMSIVYPNNRGHFLTMKEGDREFTNCDIRNISQDSHGRIWAATDNEGIICIQGNPKNVKSLRFKQYNLIHRNLPINDAVKCLEDKRGRLWAISSSGGLFLYNKEKDIFEVKNKEYHLSGDRALSLEEDDYGSLWLTTNKSLVRITWKQGSDQPHNITYFTKEDGLGDLQFSDNVSCKMGKELFFGSRTSFFSFMPSRKFNSKEQNSPKLIVTDLLIDDQPFDELDSLQRADISEQMPAYTRNIKIPANIKKFDIEFSLLTYGDNKKNVYAYQLEGYDEDWLYCTGETHRASYQNLKAGTYKLHVKATDSYGIWQELPYTIAIKVLPPWYASRIAFMLYILLFIGGIFATARWYKDRLKTKNSLQMGVILTNITHELLTPLTVISATIYKLKNIAPQYEEDYWVMDSNINRTTRLLRQILEVRKSQAGQLRLLVSRGDLSLFVKNACENIRPMAEHQKITIRIDLPRGETYAWFDADKMDKILYNLLSNAIKYNKENGHIDVSLSQSKDTAAISVSDDGIGMSKQKLKHLYTRFFDGDYRKQNMPGTGIGLSLTHDLVKLHHGDIQCESIEGKGTTFIITFPVRKSDYRYTEIDHSEVSRQMDNLAIEQVKKEEGDDKKVTSFHNSIFIRKNAYKILVVEDNEELLALMLQVLSKNYHVLTAKNGKQAMNIVMKEKLDLVVSDVMMPVMDGIELTKRIKGDKSFWQLPVILLTAKNREEDKTEAYSIGADGYIIKPFKFEELEVRINALLANRKKIVEKVESEAILQVSEHEMPAGKVAVVDGAMAHDHLSNPDRAFVARATEQVMKHLDDADYDRDSFAKDMAMGGSTLYNKVKATTGQTVVAFVTTIRMREAMRILQGDPNILINDLAARVGFNTPKYFSKCFKREYGMFPSEYAEKLRKS